MGASDELVEFWCADCRAATRFELVAVDGHALEYACVSCGAAYIDGAVEPVVVETTIRGVA